MLAGDVPPGESQKEKLELIVRDLPEAEPIERQFYVYGHMVIQYRISPPPARTFKAEPRLSILDTSPEHVMEIQEFAAKASNVMGRH